MSSAVTIAAVVTAVVAVGSAAYSAVSASDAADEAAALQEEQAKQEQAAAQTEAEKIRERGQRIAGTQAAAMAASGIKLDGQGSSSALLNETKTLAESDAMAAITGGNNRAKLLNGEAQINKDRATSSLVAGGLNATASAVGSYNSYQKSLQASKSAESINAGTSALTTRKTKYSLLGD